MYCDALEEERQSQADARKLQALYPETARRLQRLAEEACDRLEYEGSMMFDEYVDPLQLRLLASEIAGEAMAMEENERETEGTMQKQKAAWLQEMAIVLLADEMHRRRRRHRSFRQRRIWTVKQQWNKN